MIPQYCRYSIEGPMHKNIRIQTNKIFQKIQQSPSQSSDTNAGTKQLDRRKHSRYHIAAK